MIVFLDVDGTYAHHGVVPQVHVQAVRDARARGHHVLLCTGRPMPMLPPALLAAGFDGVVAGAGAYVEIGGHVLKDVRFPARLAARTVQVLDEHDAAYVLEAPDRLLGPPGVRDRADRAFAALQADREPRAGRLDFLDTLEARDDLSEASFGKVTVLVSRTPIVELGRAVGPGVATITSSIPGMGTSAGEIYLADIHKALGAQLAAEHLGHSHESAVAVGDGLNDVELLAWAGTGVAVEGAPPAVLAAADRVAPGPERGGIALLFSELGLIAR
ncbi:HAD hydrolase family protein [Cellulomonas soli]|uniref:Haloacid dehalogenase n=1 Tax=Cellulomonas soli TaxID=931535 RepID=A0A512PD27_9CELL|nr:HAD hydrolase family protein [Cellulomonas soli]NYI60233.1 hypothetical protein [Cellulomonas soli]GEP69113.1 haloacid dehalogenase [Cellulomonas soli]